VIIGKHELMYGDVTRRGCTVVLVRFLAVYISVRMTKRTDQGNLAPMKAE